MNHDIMARHRGRQTFQIAYVAGHDPQAWVFKMTFVMPFSTRGEVIVERQPRDGGVGQQRIGEMTTDEAGTADDHVAVAEVSACESCGGHWGISGEPGAANALQGPPGALQWTHRALADARAVWNRNHLDLVALPDGPQQQLDR